MRNYTDAVWQTSCTRCGAKSGRHCTSPNGDKLSTPHTQRVVAAKVGDR